MTTLVRAEMTPPELKALRKMVQRLNRADAERKEQHLRGLAL